MVELRCERIEIKIARARLLTMLSGVRPTCRVVEANPVVRRARVSSLWFMVTRLSPARRVLVGPFCRLDACGSGIGPPLLRSARRCRAGRALKSCRMVP